MKSPVADSTGLKVRRGIYTALRDQVKRTSQEDEGNHCIGGSSLSSAGTEPNILAIYLYLLLAHVQGCPFKVLKSPSCFTETSDAHESFMGVVCTT